MIPSLIQSASFCNQFRGSFEAGNLSHLRVKLSAANYFLNLSINLVPILDTETPCLGVTTLPAWNILSVYGKLFPLKHTRRPGRLLNSAQYALGFNTWLGLNPTLYTQTSRNSGFSLNSKVAQSCFNPSYIYWIENLFSPSNLIIIRWSHSEKYILINR